MKTLKITTIIIIAFIFGALTQNIYATSARLIMIPDTIGGYNTLDLLNYIAQKKAKEDIIVIPKLITPQIQQIVKPIRGTGINVSV